VNEPGRARRPRRVYRYRIDFEGRILHDGSEIGDPDVIRQLLANPRRDADGTSFSLCLGERNELDAEDVLYVIGAFDAPPPSDDATGLPVRCQGGLARRLDLTTLRLAGEAYLYGEVEGGVAARFGRRAWLEFANRFVREDQGKAVAEIGGRSFPIAPGQPRRNSRDPRLRPREGGR
jgi:hypothetical protein